MTSRLAAAWSILLTLALLASPTAVAKSDPAQVFGEELRVQIDDALAELRASGEFEGATTRFQGLFDQAVAYAGDGQHEVIEDAAYALRLVRQLAAADPAKAPERLAYLLDNEKLARTLVFLVDERADDLPGVYNTLDALRAAQGRRDRLDEYATLTASICVVHDVPRTRQTHEDIDRAASPAGLWRFYAANERRMYFGLKGVPGELLVFVIDNHASLAEIEWALSKYAGDRAVGRQFFNIAYDYEHFNNGVDKKVLAKGYTLPNIRQYGGVCADQAYFAVTAGKSIGVPAVYTVGAGTSTSHAWVGYLEQRGRTAAWNFDEGRYEEYKGVRGSVLDPQTRRTVADSEVAVLAEMIGASLTDVRRAAALLEAANRLGELERGGGAYPPKPLKGIEGLTAREAGVAQQLELIEQSLRGCAGYKRSWQRVAELARQRRLSMGDKKRWADVLDRLCGGRYPDFTVDILTPMIHSIEDIEERDKFWVRLGKTCGKRKDLAAYCKIEQGKMWEQAGEKARAYDCFKSVIDTYINDGPFALEALQRAEKMLVEARRADVIVDVYGAAFARTTRPDFAAIFATQSNWFRVGTRYAYWLERVGDSRAQSIKNQLDGIRNAQ